MTTIFVVFIKYFEQIKMQLQILSFVTISLSCLAYVNAVPTDGLTKRAPGVIGLDVDIVQVDGPDATVQHHKRAANVVLHRPGIFYIGYFDIGSTKQQVGLAMDTGSADMWVPTPQAPSAIRDFGSYNPNISTTLKSLGRSWGGGYALSTNNQLEAEIYTDNVAFTNESVVLEDFQFGVVTETVLTWGCGICGISLPEDEASRPIYPNLPQALKNGGFIAKNAYSLFLTSEDQSTGSFLFGGIDLDKIDGPLVPIPSADPKHLTGSLSIYLESLGINGQTFNYSKPIVLDSGAPYSFLEESVFSNVLKSEYGWDGHSTRYGFPVVTEVPAGNLSFNLDGITIEVPQESLIVKDNTGPDYIRLYPSTMQLLGANFLKYAYVVYNNDERAVSIGKIKFSNTSNIVNI